MLHVDESKSETESVAREITAASQVVEDAYEEDKRDHAHQPMEIQENLD